MLEDYEAHLARTREKYKDWVFSPNEILGIRYKNHLRKEGISISPRRVVRSPDNAVYVITPYDLPDDFPRYEAGDWFSETPELIATLAQYYGPNAIIFDHDPYRVFLNKGGDLMGSYVLIPVDDFIQIFHQDRLEFCGYSLGMRIEDENHQVWFVPSDETFGMLSESENKEL